MAYLNYEIRPMTRNDLPQVMVIENSSFLNPWKEKDLIYEMEENPVSNIWVLEISNEQFGLRQICAFCDYWVTFDSGTICQIAVHPDIRREHLGSMMMEEIIKDAKAKKVNTLTLEVRKSNEAAIRLYQKFGFYVSHVKPGYYADGEDAIYMIKEVNK